MSAILYKDKVYGAGGSGGGGAISDLSDVDLDNLSDGQVLKYNSTSQKWENEDESGGGGASAVADLTDVELTNLSDGQILKYDAQNQKWINTDGVIEGAYAIDKLFEQNDFTAASGTSEVTHSYTLSKSIDEYDAVLVEVWNHNQYYNNVYTRTHLQTFLVLKSDYYTTREPATGNADRVFFTSANFGGNDRRLYFRFSNSTTINTAAIRSQNNEEPKLYRVFGIRFGTQSIVYDLNEREVGVWLDGKPLYQKTFDLGADVNIPSNAWTDVNVPNTGLKALIYIICGSTAGAALCGFSATLNTAGTNIRILQSRNATIGVRYVTIQYTKITD